MGIHGEVDLRGQQKRSRKQAILAAAKSLFERDGFEETSVQNIANKAMVSAPTVYNYFGAKAGVVMAIIIESDRHLVTQVAALVDRSEGIPVEDMKALLSLMVSESLRTFDALTWRHVFATAILDPENVIGKGYRDQNIRLYDGCEELLAKCVAVGNLPKGLDLKILRDLCERINHTLFEQLVSGEIQTFENYEKLLQERLEVFL